MFPPLSQEEQHIPACIWWSHWLSILVLGWRQHEDFSSLNYFPTTFHMPLVIMTFGQSKPYQSEDYWKNFKNIINLINNTFVQTQFGMAIGPESSRKVILRRALLCLSQKMLHLKLHKLSRVSQVTRREKYLTGRWSPFPSFSYPGNEVSSEKGELG